MSPLLAVLVGIALVGGMAVVVMALIMLGDRRAVRRARLAADQRKHRR